MSSSNNNHHDKSRSIAARRRRAELAYTKLRTSRNSESDSRLQLRLAQFKTTNLEEGKIYQQYDFQSMASYCATIQALAALAGVTVTFNRQSVIKIDVLSAIADDDGYGVHPPKVLKSDGVSITIRIPLGHLGVNRTADWCMYIPTLLSEPPFRNDQTLGTTLISCYSTSCKSFQDSTQCMVSVTSNFEIFKASKSGIAILPQDVVEGTDHCEYTQQLSWLRHNRRFLIRTDRVCNVLTLRTKNKRLSSPFRLQPTPQQKEGKGARQQSTKHWLNKPIVRNAATSRYSKTSSLHRRDCGAEPPGVKTPEDRDSLDHLDEPPKWKQKLSVS